MSKELQKMKRMMAKKMGYKMSHRMRVPTKSASASLLKAKFDKKKLPRIKHTKPHKDDEYKNLSIEDYEKKYPPT